MYANECLSAEEFIPMSNPDPSGYRGTSGLINAKGERKGDCVPGRVAF
jgi:hypothetical protein